MIYLSRTAKFLIKNLYRAGGVLQIPTFVRETVGNEKNDVGKVTEKKNLDKKISRD